MVMFEQLQDHARTMPPCNYGLRLSRPTSHYLSVLSQLAHKTPAENILPTASSAEKRLGRRQEKKRLLALGRWHQALASLAAGEGRALQQPCLTLLLKLTRIHTQCYHSTVISKVLNTLNKTLLARLYNHPDSSHIGILVLCFNFQISFLLVKEALPSLDGK